MVKMRLGSDVAEGAIAHIAIQLQRFGVWRQAEIATQRLLGRNVVAGDEKIGKPVVVVVEKPGRETLPGFLHASFGGDVGESAVVIVVIEKIVAVEIRDVEIHVTVVVEISRDDAFGERDLIDAGGMRDVFERAVALVAKELAGAVLVADKKIEEAVVVDVGPDSRL